MAINYNISTFIFAHFQPWFMEMCFDLAAREVTEYLILNYNDKICGLNW